MKNKLIILSFMFICPQLRAIEDKPNLFYRLGKTYAAFKANPYKTIGRAGLTVGRYGIYMSIGTGVGAGVGAVMGAAAIERSQNSAVTGLPVITGLLGGAFGMAAGVLCAYKHKNIWSKVRNFGSRVKNDFTRGSQKS